MTLFLLLVSCGKSKIDIEENIVFETNSSGAIINAASSYPFTAILKSKMPSNGIEIQVTATEELNGIEVLPQKSINKSLIASNDLIVQNLPRQKWVVVNVKVKSLTNPLNFSDKSFRVIFK